MLLAILVVFTKEAKGSLYCILHANNVHFACNLASHWLFTVTLVDDSLAGIHCLVVAAVYRGTMIDKTFDVRAFGFLISRSLTNFPSLSFVIFTPAACPVPLMCCCNVIAVEFVLHA